MKERPILFSGPMVRALLAGTKTQTRRVVKPQPTHFNPVGVPRRVIPTGGPSDVIRCPYGQPGDRLWVRETWAYGIHALAAKRDENGPFVYAADGTTQGRLCDRWRPSIHMPRWASRITLEVTSVRVERLQDIDLADALAEGISDTGALILDSAGNEQGGPIAEYAVLWEQINGSGSWAANPWVWAIEFNQTTATR